MSDWTLETALTTSLGIEHWALSIEIVDSFIWRISRSFFRCHKKNPPINMLTPNEYDGSYLKSYECASKTEPKDFIWWFSLFVGWLVFLYKMPGFEIYDRNDENFHSIDERHEQKAPIASCNLCKLNSLRTPIKSQALQRLFSSSSAQFILCLFHAYSARFNALA